MTDELAQLHNNINDLKQKLMSYMNPDESFSDSEMNKYNAHTVVQQAMNYINENKRTLISNGDYHYFTNSIGELQADYSSLMTAQRNPTNVTYHAANKVMHIIETMAKHDDSPTADEVTKLLRFRHQHEYNPQTDSDSDRYEDPSDKSTNPYWEITPRFQKYVKDLWDENKYNYNIWGKDPDTFEDPNSSWTMARGVLNWLGYRDQANDFLNKYGRLQPNYQAYQYNHKTFYFPQDMTRGLTQADLAGLINDGYYKNLDNQKTYSKLTDNWYRKMWHSLYNNNFNDAQKKVGGNYLDDLNNHPTDSLPAEQQMSNAMTKYNYQIQKDRIWQQYHQNQINRMTDYAKQLENYRDNVQKRINRLCHWHGRYYNDSNKYSDHHLIKNKTRVKEIDKLSKQRDHWDRLIANRLPGGQFYKMEVNGRDKWKSAADKLNSQLPSEEKQERLNALLTATTDNLKTDARYGHFGYIRPRNPETEDSYVFMMITEESPTHTTEATTSPVEWGRNITTGTQKQPTEIEVSGYLFNYDLPQSAQDGQASQEPNDGHGLDPVLKDDENLSNWQDDGAEMFYSGTHEYPHCIITSWNPDYNTGSDGNITACSFSMELQVVDYFMSNTDQKSGSKHGKSNNKGNLGTKNGKIHSMKHHRCYRVKKGQNLSTIAIRLGVPFSKLYDANKSTIRNPNLIYPHQKLIIPSK